MESTATTLPDPGAVAATMDPVAGGSTPPGSAEAGAPKVVETPAGSAERDTITGALAFRGDAARVTPQPYNFANRSRLSDPELRKLRSDYEACLESLAARFSIYFRTEFDFALESLQTLSYREFVGGLQQPTHVTLFKVEPLRGIGLLEVGPGFGLTLTDRMMGGPGQAPATVRDLSEIEVALLDQVAQFITEGWCDQWGQRPELRAALLGHENDPRYLQTAAPDSAMLVAVIKARLGKTSGQIQLAFSFVTLEPLLQKLRTELQPAAEAAPEVATPKAAPWNAALNEIQIAITAELPGPQLLARAIPQLKVGEVIDLPQDSVNRIQLCLGGLTRFTGRLGTRDNSWAVEVTRVEKT